MTDFAQIFNKGYVEFEDGSKETVIFLGINPDCRVVIRTKENQYMIDENDRIWKYMWYNPQRRKYEYRFDINRIWLKEDIVK